MTPVQCGTIIASSKSLACGSHRGAGWTGEMIDSPPLRSSLQSLLITSRNALGCRNDHKNNERACPVPCPEPPRRPAGQQPVGHLISGGRARIGKWHRAPSAPQPKRAPWLTSTRVDGAQSRVCRDDALELRLHRLSAWSFSGSPNNSQIPPTLRSTWATTRSMMTEAG